LVFDLYLVLILRNPALARIFIWLIFLLFYDFFSQSREILIIKALGKSFQIIARLNFDL